MSCSIKGCGNPVYVKKRGLCRAHYLRWHKYGDPEFFPNHQQPTGSDAAAFKHGAWGRPVFKVWRHMIDRCTNPNNRAYHHYGGRGITVCDRWRDDYFAFENDMGPRPPGATLERINNHAGYTPSNCKWANATQQSRNRRLVKLTKAKADEIRRLPRRTVNGRGEGYTRQEIADMYGVSVATIKKVLSGAYWK